MEIKLRKAFARNSPVDKYDVHVVKHALARLGYYEADSKVGITNIPDDQVFEGLKRFQSDNDISPTGAIKPGDETEETLGKAVDELSGYYIWRTVQDDKVRSSHAALDGTVRKYGEGLEPGDDYNCRCMPEDIVVEAGLVPGVKPRFITADLPVPERKPKFDSADVDVPVPVRKPERNPYDFSWMQWKEKSKENIKDFEGDVVHPYLDTKGVITVGVGINVHLRDSFMSLPWRFGAKTGPLATKEQIEEGYEDMLKLVDEQLKANSKRIANDYKRETELRLDNETRNRLFGERYDAMEAELAKYIGEAKFEALPPDARAALMDMRFNMGASKFNRKKWNNFFRAVAVRDWLTAANESHRKDVRDKRNDWTYKQLKNSSDMKLRMESLSQAYNQFKEMLKRDVSSSD